MGDTEFTSLAASFRLAPLMFVAADLGEHVPALLRDRQTVHRLGRLTAIYMFDLDMQMLANVAGECDDPTCLTEKYL